MIPIKCHLTRTALAIAAAIYSTNALATTINNNNTWTVDSVISDTNTVIGEGEGSDGTLIITAGGELTTNYLSAGRVGSTGRIEVNSGGILNVTGATTSYPFNIGGTPDGLGASAASASGYLTISGEGSLVEFSNTNVSSSTINIGMYGKGNTNGSGFVNILDGGKLINNAITTTGGGSIRIGSLTNGSTAQTSGTVVVDGTDSELSSVTPIIVGYEGTGTLVTSGGAYTHTDVNLDTGSTVRTLTHDNTLTVTGENSVISAGTYLTAGLSGKGAIIATDGGKLSAPEIRIATNAGSLGEMAVGGRAGENAATAGIIDTDSIVFGAGVGVLTLNHTSSDFSLAADLSGNGTINALSGTTTLLGDNLNYQGGINIDAPAALVISEQQNIGTNDIAMAGGVLDIRTNHDWQLSNTLTGQGTLVVNTGGNHFNFNDALQTDNFNGTLTLQDSRFSLDDINTDALQTMTLNAGTDSEVTVGDSRQTLSGLTFDGGTLVFGDVVPGQTTTANTVHTVDSLDISGDGTVQITPRDMVSHDTPAPDGSIPLLAQDEGNILVQLVSGSGSVTGSGGNLTLADQSGNIITNGGTTSNISQNGNVVAQGTYDYRLTGGDNGDGLYVSYGLAQVTLQGQDNDALALASEGRTGNAADLSAKLTGAGDLAIDTGAGNTLSLSNMDNDYSGITDIRSGTLLMRNNNVLGNTPRLQMAQNTALEMNGYRQIVGSVDITDSARVSLDGGSLAVSDGGLITGELTGGGSLALNGGTLRVDGANSSLTAGVSVAENATADLNAAQGLGTGALNLEGGVNLDTAEGVLENNLSNSGTLALHVSHIQLAGDNRNFSGIFTTDADSNLMISTAAHLGGGAVENEGLLTLSTNESWQLNNRVSGSGNLVKNGAGIVTLGRDSTLYTGSTDIQQGGLTFGAGNNSATLASSQVMIHDAGSLAGNGIIAGSVINQGILQVGALPEDETSRSATARNAFTGMDTLTLNGNLTSNGLARIAGASGSGTPGNRLMVNGDYTGNDGHLIFRTALNDDDSATDHMTVTGNTLGRTHVSVTNAGGTGAQTLDGIELINVGGNSDGEFIQDGRIVAGAYDYSLVRGKGNAQGNWYLTSMTETTEPDEPEPGETENPGEAQLRPETGSYLANSLAANTLFITQLHDRAGETLYTDALTGEKKVTSMWIRNVGGHTRFNDVKGQIHTRSNSYVLQGGGDLAQWSTNGLDGWHLGAMGGYANNQSRSASGLTGYSSRGQVNGYSAGLYSTWYANDEDKAGTYVDTWMLYNWFDNTVKGQGLVTEKYKSRGMTVSAEAGYSLKMAENGRNSYWLQPKAQVIWMDVQADTHQEQNSTRVQDNTNGNLMTRLGLKGYIRGHSVMDDDTDHTFQPFVEMNWIHNTRMASVSMNGVRNEMRGTKNVGELKAGVEGQITPQLNLWGNVSQQVGDKGYSDTQGILGVKYLF